MSVFDWELHRFGNGVECIFTPREKHDGKPLREGLINLKGEKLTLFPSWCMDETDPYPGEWALSSPFSLERGHDVFGLLWIASGDVTPVNKE